MMTIIPRGTGYLLDLRNTGSGGHCGAGAQFPESVFIATGSKVCKVKLGKY